MENTFESGLLGYSAVAGETDVRQLVLSPTAQVAAIRSVVKHRDWEGVASKPDNNLCLAFLKEGEEFDLEAGDEVGALNLVNNPPLEDVQCDVAGWRLSDPVRIMMIFWLSCFHFVLDSAPAAATTAMVYLMLL